MGRIIEAGKKCKVKKAVIMCMQMSAIEVSPARYQLIREMNEHGVEIYLILCGRLSISAQIIHKNIKYFLNAKGKSSKEIQRKIVEYKPDIVVAFTCEDTDILYKMPIQLKSTDFYYYNLEISTQEYYMQGYKKYSCKWVMKKIKYPFSRLKEFIYTKQCKLLIIQDRERKKIAQRYCISHKNTMLIPNSYIYDKCIGLDTNRSGIVYSGGARKKYLADFLEGFNRITTVSIVFAGSFDDWSREQIMKLHKTNPNIVMATQTLESEEYTKYLQKYAVGLICYSKSDDDNINHIGLSSGKFFKHLSLGQPVITLGGGMISHEVRRYGLGIVIHNASQIECAYKKIMDNYDWYQKNIIRVYKNKYDFKKVVTPFLEYL